MDKKLVIVTTDMEIDCAVMVNRGQVHLVEEAAEEARKKYYDMEISDYDLFDDELAEQLDNRGIEFEFVEFDEV